VHSAHDRRFFVFFTILVILFWR